MNVNSFEKDILAILDYKFDLAPKTHGTGESDWLAVGETIATAVVESKSTELTVVSYQIDADNLGVSCWLSGGQNQKHYTVTCFFTTNQNRQDERSIEIYTRQR